MKIISNEIEELSHADLALGVHTEIAKDARKLEALAKAAERAMTNRNETNSEVYFVEVENRIAELENS